MIGSNEELVQHLSENTKVLKSEKIKEAFRVIDRKFFVQKDYQPEVYEDYALPTMEGQTISQPTVVAFMIEKLEPQKGDKILDIGSGSGWTTALLAHIVGDEGRVLGLEINEEVAKYGQDNLAKFNFPQAEIRIAREGETGFPKEAPYDRILVSAAFESSVPKDLFNQLKDGGKLVAPVDHSVQVFSKDEEGETEKEVFPGFVFVPYLD